MEILKHLQRQKTGVRPHQIIFNKKNKKNIDISWKDKMKPSIKLEDGITFKEYQALAARWDEMLSLAEEILWRNYLDPKSEEIISEVDSFPDIRYLTGNYYVGHVSYGYAHRDKKHRPYQIKEGRLRHKYHNGKEWVAVWLPLDSPEITRYYRIRLSLRLTGDEDGKEEDYMCLDLVTEFVKLDAPLEFEIHSWC
ncbi:MAG: hypothetical protein K2O06_11585 [Acetatifactor sp.]|nr:hypothetical protein [Acetatifactor sp.]